MPSTATLPQQTETITMDRADLDRLVAEQVARALGDRVTGPQKAPDPLGSVPRGGPVGAKPTHPVGIKPGYTEEGFEPVTFTCVQNPYAKILRDGTLHPIRFAYGVFVAHNSQDVQRVRASALKVYEDDLKEPMTCPTCRFSTRASGAIVAHMATEHVR